MPWSTAKRQLAPLSCRLRWERLFFLVFLGLFDEVEGCEISSEARATTIRSWLIAMLKGVKVYLVNAVSYQPSWEIPQ